MNLRAFCIVSYILGFLIKSTPERSHLRDLAKTDPAESFRISHGEVKRILRTALNIAGATVDVSGLENIPEEPCLYVGNHCSYFDILVAETTIPSGVGFVAKDGLKKIPLLSAWMELIRCLFLNRDNVKEGLKTILEGSEYIKEGFPMCIFPEGTRSKNGQMGEFKGGSLKMAQKANALIVPMAISGTAALFENNEGLRVMPGHVKVSYGTPFRISELSKEEKRNVTEYTKALIQKMLDEQKELTLSA
ncbi:MAG: 1-acyl-sn-glycerol-3-phosphate acyltransferase [Clostridiales bacterium]|nr:1-acyl-sn-glycerol-3-phosphate acyltransferase [Clostridiales bacterium]